MMRTVGYGFAMVVPLALVLTLGALVSEDETIPRVEPASLEAVNGSDIWRITLTESAAKRLDIQTAVVEKVEDRGLAVPSSALIITPDGSSWLYTNPSRLVYQRHEITSVVEEDGMAHFVDGPPADSKVVVVGVPELYGTEFGIGK